MDSLITEYLGHLSVEKGASPHTIAAYRRDLTDYVTFLKGRGITQPGAVRRDDVTAFIAELRTRGLAPSTIERRVAALKGFHKFLVREGITENHPTARLPLPKVPARLPVTLSIDDLERLLSQPFPDTPAGLRDRAILETLYGCGMRVSELTGLELTDIDLADGFVRVFGKGSKERLAPIAGMAEHALDAYLRNGRPFLRPRGQLVGTDSSAVFVSVRGRRITRQAVFEIVRKYGAHVGLELHPHTL